MTVMEKTPAKEEEEGQVELKRTEPIKNDAERDPDGGFLALELSVQCLKKLKMDHFRELNALTKPPAQVCLVCEVLCIIFNLKPVTKDDPDAPGEVIYDYWETSRKELLSDPKTLLEKLFNFDRDNISDGIISSIAPYMHRQDFDAAAIRKISICCEAICLWVRGIYKYHFVAKTVDQGKLHQAVDRQLQLQQ